MANLAYKTKRLVEEGANQEGLGRLTKSVTFDLPTLEALRSDKGTDEGKVFNLVRGLQKEIYDSDTTAPILQPIKERAERILKDMESRKVTGLAAMDLLAALAAEKEAAVKALKESGLSEKAFAVYWALRDDPGLKAKNIGAKHLAQQVEAAAVKFPNAAVNPDEQRLRAEIYNPIVGLSKEERARVVESVVSNDLIRIASNV